MRLGICRARAELCATQRRPTLQQRLRHLTQIAGGLHAERRSDRVYGAPITSNHTWRASKAAKKKAKAAASDGTATKKKKSGVAPTRGKRKAAPAGSAGLAPDDVSALSDAAADALAKHIKDDGGVVLARYKDPLFGKAVVFAVLPLEKVERTIFQRLLGATGLGPRLALAILSTLGPERAVRSIQGKDVAALSTVSGIGKKRAEKLIVELSDRFSDLAIAPAPGRSRPADEAAKALLALGYAQAVADEAVRAALAEARTDDVAALVRRALQQLTTPRGGRG